MSSGFLEVLQRAIVEYEGQLLLFSCIVSAALWICYSSFTHSDAKGLPGVRCLRIDPNRSTAIVICCLLS